MTAAMTADELVDRIRVARDKAADIAGKEREIGGAVGLASGDKFVHAIRADTQIRIAGALNDILGDVDWVAPT